MCGIVGLHLKGDRHSERLGELLAGMFVQVRERGPDSGGVGVYADAGLTVLKEVGDPADLVGRFGLAGRSGFRAIGHTRMATESLVDVAHSHPFWARPFADISVVHNGHITNYHKLRRKLEEKGHRFATGNDSEAIAVYIADKLEAGESLEDALRASVHDLDGTFAYLISTPDGIGVARDRFALKPMVVAEDDEVVLLASEEIALRTVSGDRDLTPLELGAGEVRWWLR